MKKRKKGGGKAEMREINIFVLKVNGQEIWHTYALLVEI